MNEIIPAVQQPPVFQAMPENAARLNITWDGSNGDLPETVPYDAPDADLRRMAMEAVQHGDVPGITGVDGNVNMDDFVVERYNATEEIPYARVFVRPKTPFGA